ncbi:hypothetical protein SAMN05216293_1736 [Flagellimonas taeanensis]|uniref:Uncharacterized protein n=1 Tax=Flagellimonas taeanensis TaxID=1005926 RepID=A0A1M6UR61_9FLAO|nr:hypothetical protein SAMN05216293_1736 [Allomuricauda taeanensis]
MIYVRFFLKRYFLLEKTYLLSFSLFEYNWAKVDREQAI